MYATSGVFRFYNTMILFNFGTDPAHIVASWRVGAGHSPRAYPDESPPFPERQ